MATSVEQELDAEIERPRRRRRRWLWLALAVVVLAGAGATYWFVVRDDGSEPASDTTGPAATAEVTRETISATESYSGTLGHGDPFTVTAAAASSSASGQDSGDSGDSTAADSGSGSGTITRIAEPDSKVKRGTELYRLNEQPVIVMIGDIPMYRDLQAGDTGVDVKQLESNLSKLGYDGFTVDDEFTWLTELAVMEWQDDVDGDETGVVTQSSVVFVPEGGRVDTVHVTVGQTVQAGAEVLDISGSEDVASLEVDVADRDLVEVGTAVTVTLPDGKDVKGEVTAAKVVAEESDTDAGAAAGAGGDEGGSAEDSVVAAEVTLNKSVDESLIGSPVDVVVDIDERKDVLVVPVNALLALSEGGYGIEIVSKDDSAMTSEIVAVETGLFAEGKVEITSDGIDEGTLVGVAGR